jgi:hypothetical protein
VAVKYLYCTKCKDLRVKPWYALRYYCSRCRADLRVIEVPRSWMTYAVYILTVLTFALVIVHVTSDMRNSLMMAVISLVAMMIIQFVDLGRGQRYARSKIRLTKSDAQRMRLRRR